MNTESRGRGASRARDPEFMTDLKKTLEIAVKFKASMQKRHLRSARCVCPRCGDFIWGTLSGRRDHLYMHCKGTCKMVFME